MSRGALCWHGEGSVEPGCSGCHLLCFFFRDSFPRVQNFCNQRHHGVTVQAGSCSHKTIPEGESRRTWISAQIPQRGSSPLPPPGQMCFGRLRAGWPMPQGAQGLAADLLGLGTESGGRGRGDVSQAPCPAGVSIPVLAFPVLVMGQRGLCQISCGRCWKLSLFSVPTLLVLL